MTLWPYQGPNSVKKQSIYKKKLSANYQLSIEVSVDGIRFNIFENIEFEQIERTLKLGLFEFWPIKIRFIELFRKIFF